jgi:hypothetical protein
MAPSEYSLRLQKGELLVQCSGIAFLISLFLGITGGFAPPTPNAIYTVTRPKDHSTLNITCAERPTGTPSLQDLAPKSRPHDADAEKLVEELHGILKQLPTEVPMGSEDIYGMDTSIAWGSDDLMWCNGGPAGCGGGKSSVQPTQEQKKSFRRAVEIVEELVKE